MVKLIAAESEFFFLPLVFYQVELELPHINFFPEFDELGCTAAVGKGLVGNRKALLSAVAENYFGFGLFPASRRKALC